MHVARTLAAALAALACLAGPARAAAEEYEFVPDTKRLMALLGKDTLTLGHLDETGAFTPDRKYPVGKRGMGFSAVPVTYLMNASPGTAYEYRSGRLILGEIDQDGNFVPALRSKVIAFEQYQPGGNAPPIYNLPGRFVKKGEKKDNSKP